jgi:hypothetical protein
LDVLVWSATGASLVSTGSFILLISAVCTVVDIFWTPVCAVLCTTFFSASESRFLYLSYNIRDSIDQIITFSVINLVGEGWVGRGRMKGIQVFYFHNYFLTKC